jgi:probable H4MPT-linked C1 transfer pathway protein
MTAILGWDVGGVNTKVARVIQGAVAAARARPYEIQREPAALPSLLARLAADLDPAGLAAHAVTMTAELSQLFRTKREGVGFVLGAVTTAFPEAPVRVYAVDGRFLSVAEARAEPLAVAAANWVAAARLVAQSFPDAVFIDVGTTTTDVIPITGGRVAARGRTDYERLREGELVYTGALRTPAEAVAQTVRVRGAPVGVSAEGFALAGDAHLWLGSLAPEDYTVPTPDGRPATREFAGERLARVVCADRELLDEAAIDAIAHGLAEAQVGRVTEAVVRVRHRHPGVADAVVTGLGDFMAAEAARRAGLRVTHLGLRLGAAARHAPAAAVALLLEAELAPHDARP